jgi:hypothetical protein
MFASSGSLNLYAKQAPSILVEVSDRRERGFFCLSNVLVVLLNQVFDENARPLKKLRAPGFISSFRSERADSNINDGAIYTSSLSA